MVRRDDRSGKCPRLSVRVPRRTVGAATVPFACRNGQRHRQDRVRRRPTRTRHRRPLRRIDHMRAQIEQTFQDLGRCLMAAGATPADGASGLTLMLPSPTSSGKALMSACFISERHCRMRVPSSVLHYDRGQSPSRIRCRASPHFAVQCHDLPDIRHARIVAWAARRQRLLRHERHLVVPVRFLDPVIGRRGH